MTPLECLEAWLLSVGSSEETKKWSALTSSLGSNEDGSDPSQMKNIHRADPAYGHYRRIFGDQRGRGEVIFYDAFPTDLPETLFEIDIINVHYQDYYTSGGTTPPADYLSPVPIFFLTVAPSVPFRFLAVCKDPELKCTLSEWLKGALKEKGIGAKTALGYGAFDFSEAQGGSCS